MTSCRNSSASGAILRRTTATVNMSKYIVMHFGDMKKRLVGLNFFVSARSTRASPQNYAPCMGCLDGPARRGMIFLLHQAALVDLFVNRTIRRLTCYPTAMRYRWQLHPQWFLERWQSPELRMLAPNPASLAPSIPTAAITSAPIPEPAARGTAQIPSRHPPPVIRRVSGLTAALPSVTRQPHIRPQRSSRSLNRHASSRARRMKRVT